MPIIFRTYFLIAVLASKANAQALPLLVPKIISVKFTEFAIGIAVQTSDSLRKQPFRYGPPADWVSSQQEPLYVIDGKLASSETLKKIDPYDIENIEVVKGIQAAALYGQKGINGVIVITTKRHGSNKQKKKDRLN